MAFLLSVLSSLLCSFYCKGTILEQGMVYTHSLEIKCPVLALIESFWALSFLIPTIKIPWKYSSSGGSYSALSTCLFTWIYPSLYYWAISHSFPALIMLLAALWVYVNYSIVDTAEAYALHFVVLLLSGWLCICGSSATLLLSSCILLDAVWGCHAAPHVGGCF